MKKRIVFLLAIVIFSAIGLFTYNNKALLSEQNSTSGDCGCNTSCMGGKSCSISCPVGQAAHCDCVGSTPPLEAKCYCR